MAEHRLSVAHPMKVGILVLSRETTSEPLGIYDWLKGGGGDAQRHQQQNPGSGTIIFL